MTAPSFSRPEFSFITPTYNCCRFVRRCYWSLCHQTISNWEWVVIDDASTDGTSELIRELNDPRISYYRLPQTQGPGLARNYGMSKARADWLVIQDMDDFSFPKRLEKARAAREQGYDFMCSYLALINSAYVLTGLRGGQQKRYPYNIPHGTICGKADILRRIGYPRYHRGEDQTMVLHLANNHSGLHLAEPLYVYHENASIKARKAMLGHYCMIQQLRDLVGRNVLRPSMGVYQAMVMSLIKMSILAFLFLLWPEFYEVTISQRKKLSKGNADPLTTEDRRFLEKAAADFPMAASPTPV